MDSQAGFATFRQPTAPGAPYHRDALSLNVALTRTLSHFLQESERAMAENPH